MLVVFVLDVVELLLVERVGFAPLCEFDGRIRVCGLVLTAELLVVLVVVVELVEFTLLVGFVELPLVAPLLGSRGGITITGTIIGTEVLAVVKLRGSGSSGGG